jgi:hypothetical protein
MPSEEIFKALGDTVKLAYQDLAQPAARELGQGLVEPAQLISRTVVLAIAPLKGLIWSFEQIEHFVKESVSAKLRERQVSNEQIITPAPYVAIPAIQGLHYCNSIPELRDMFASLLTTAMNSATARAAHPSFAEIIRQLSPDEAKILRRIRDYQGNHLPMIDVHALTPGAAGFHEAAQNFSLLSFDSHCQYPDLLPEYIDNLCRLGLTVIPPQTHLVRAELYAPIENHEFVQWWKKAYTEAGMEPRLLRKVLSKTQFGKQFLGACLD